MKRWRNLRQPADAKPASIAPHGGLIRWITLRYPPYALCVTGEPLVWQVSGKKMSSRQLPRWVT
ncbi:MAG: hypothetical protein ACYC2R_00625 [Burkholderiales bacterium]